MNLQELQDLDFENLGSASTGTKIFLLVFVAALIIGVGYWFIIKDQQERLDSREREETELRQEFTNKQRKAASLETYERQLAEMREMLRSLLRQLPSKTEMPDLLVDISQTALGAGIETELFEPRNEQLQDFYAEQPIAIRMTGGYHQFGTFVSGVASLSRVVILTMQDISLQPVEGEPGLLRMEGTVTTYRYLDDAESAAMAQGGGS